MGGRSKLSINFEKGIRLGVAHVDVRWIASVEGVHILDTFDVAIFEPRGCFVVEGTTPTP